VLTPDSSANKIGVPDKAAPHDARENTFSRLRVLDNAPVYNSFPVLAAVELMVPVSGDNQLTGNSTSATCMT
jgi:hypothetical protein